MLTEAAVNGKVDTLEGLKENVIVGRLIPGRNRRGGDEAAADRGDARHLDPGAEGGGGRRRSRLPRPRRRSSRFRPGEARRALRRSKKQSLIRRNWSGPRAALFFARATGRSGLAARSAQALPCGQGRLRRSGKPYAVAAHAMAGALLRNRRRCVLSTSACAASGKSCFRTIP